MARRRTGKMTVEEYLAIPEEAPYLEYIDGEAIEKSMGDSWHVLVGGATGFAISMYGRTHGGRSGPSGRVEFGPEGATQFRLPDQAYWAPSKPFKGGRAMQPPTLAIEIRSPDDSMASQRAKCRYYRNHGVDVCWLVDPESRTIEVFEDGRDGDVLGDGAVLTSRHLPGFELSLRQLFAVLD